jgi:hypothetical protein
MLANCKLALKPLTRLKGGGKKGKKWKMQTFTERGIIDNLHVSKNELNLKDASVCVRDMNVKLILK